MKKIVTLALALLMVLSLAGTAFADTTGSITLENPQEDKTYTAYKIFDVTFDGSGETAKYAYTIKGTDPWYAVVKNFTGLKFDEINGSGVYTVTEADGASFSAAQFAALLKNNVSGKEGVPLQVAGGKAVASDLALGYYFVDSDSGALCNLTTTDPTATIRDKNDMPFDKTASDKSVEVGQTVTFTITGKVPDTTGFATYVYTVTDTMSEGLTFNKDVTVTIGGSSVTLNPTYTANGFELNIPVVNYQESNVGDAIVITYTATVNEKAVAVISKNNAALEYTNDPNGGTTTTRVEKELYSAKIVIDKVDATNNNTKLPGAKFKLYKEENGAKKYYYYDTTAKKVTWLPTADGATEVETDANGAAEFIGLEDGTYYLEETEAPAGYNKLTKPEKVEIAGSDANNPLNVTAQVKNKAGSLLPDTGGIGTTVFYIAGAVLMLVAVVLLVTKKRMTSAE